MRPLDQLAEIAQKAALIGNDLIKTTRPQTVVEKSDRDTYTDVDIKIERKVRAYLAKITPDIDFIGEEEGVSGQSANSEYTWALDPIDGTANFVHGVPLCAVSLALLKRKEAIAAAISLPYLDLHYSAIYQDGAYVNGVATKVSDTKNLSKAVIAIGDYALGEEAHEKNSLRIGVTAALAARVERVRMFGSAAHDLVWLAEGRIDGAIILSNSTIDLAAGVLIAREAGALVVDSFGHDFTATSSEMVAATPGVLPHLLEVVRTAKR
jgi:myo-inositol-1(or 4)-monophosphatase